MSPAPLTLHLPVRPIESRKAGVALVMYDDPGGELGNVQC